jgi:CubicO group peptidase (beta-lactamase class C family)
MTGKTRHLQVVLCCAAWLLCAAPGNAQGPAKKGSSARNAAAEIEGYVAAAVQRSRFSGAILIARDGQVLVRKGYGMADVENDVAVTPETKFRIGSLTKQFTAAAVLILQERGKLQTRDPVCNYLPGCPAAWQRLTIHHLLTHTSGLPNVDHTVEARSPMSLGYVIQTFREAALEFNPGARHGYSNTNYLLLGYVIEKASGQTYESFIDENIFRPLKLTATGYDRHERILKGRASGYSLRGGGLVNASYVDMSVPFAAGGLYSTVDDLYRWEQSFYGETLLTVGSAKAMFTPHKGGYGYGWYVGEQHGRKFVGHGGWLGGFSAAIARYPDDKLTVIVLSNLDSAPVNMMARHLAAIALGVEAPALAERKVASIDPKLLDAYVGQYRLAPDLLITITKESGRLVGQATGYPKIELLPESEIEFFVKDFDARIMFFEDGKGRVTHSVLTFNGHEVQAPKIH